ncbi:MAG: O-antigen ligase family protein [Candidatus Marinimicrobia bacterium]|nr:O-antigen ligase family protein [Candidatus Neomarinimicrobiota bacterium]
MLFTPNTPLMNTRFLTHSMLLGLYFLWKYLFQKDILNQKIFLLIILLVGMGQAVYGLLQLYNIIPVPPNIGGFKVFGNFGNPSPYASFLGPFIPLSLGVYLLTEEKPNKNKFSLTELLINTGLMTFLLTLLVIPATNSRSAWLGAIVGIGIVLEYKFSIFRKFKLFFTRPIYCLPEALEVDSSEAPKVTLRGPQSDMNSLRSLRPLRLSIFLLLIVSLLVTGSIFIYNYKKDSAYGRLLQWKITANMIMDKPIFGHGFNSYGLHYNTYQADYFAAKERSELEKLIAGNSQQAHNEYLEIFTELGVVGLILFLSILFLILCNYYYAYKKQKLLSIIAFSGLIAFLIECLFTYPLQILPSLVIFVGFLSLISGNAFILRSGFSPTNESQANIDNILKMKIEPVVTSGSQKLTALVLLAVISTLAYTQYQNFNAHQKWHTANYYSSSQQYQVSAKLYEELLPILKNNGSFLLNYSGTLALDGNYSEAISLLKESEKYTNDPNLYLSLANCYKETKEYDKAEFYYKKVENIVPHQMYPKYLLCMLFNETGKEVQLKTKANEILNMKIKVNSTAIYEMQNEIKNILGLQKSILK